MNLQEYILTYIAEECAEIQQAIAKAQRFGLNDCDPKGDGSTNKENILKELNDLLGVIMVAVEVNVLPDFWCSPVAQKVKAFRVYEYMQYSKDRGTLCERETKENN